MFFAPALRTRSYAPAARAFDRSFERFLTDSFFTPASSLNVAQDDKAWTLSIDLPGVAREHLSVDIEGQVVRIETAKESPRAFQAAYELPEEIDADATTATLENGVLTLKLARKVPVSTSRKIEIR